MLFSLIAMVVGIIGSCIFIYIMWSRYPRKGTAGAALLTDTAVQEYDSFQHGLKSETMKPAEVVHYGKTRFAYDETTEKIFIQTGRIPQGMAISCADITYYEMVRDGETIAPEAVFTDTGGLSEYAGETCSDLYITVWTADGSKVSLPILESAAGYQYAYIYAAEAACEITVALKSILKKQSLIQPSNSISSEI